MNVSSSGHRYSDVDLDDPNFARTPYDPMVAYGRSKTANILFAVEFDRRHRARGVRATALHPGGIKTELGRHMQADELDKMRRQHLRHRQGDAFAGRDVEEFVGAVGVGVRAQHAGDDELRVGELLAQHAHERDRAALAHHRRRRAEGRLRGLLDGRLQPGRQRRRVPAGSAPLAVEGDLRAVGRIGLQQVSLHQGRGLRRLQRRRQAQADSFSGVDGAQHVAGVGQRRQAVQRR